MVKILPAGHIESDTFCVCAVELIGLFVGMEVGGDEWLLFVILFSFILFFYI